MGRDQVHKLILVFVLLVISVHLVGLHEGALIVVQHLLLKHIITPCCFRSNASLILSSEVIFLRVVRLVESWLFWNHLVFIYRMLLLRKYVVINIGLSVLISFAHYVLIERVDDAWFLFVDGLLMVLGGAARWCQSLSSHYSCWNTWRTDWSSSYAWVSHLIRQNVVLNILN
jgi:hypothetical protein